MSAWNDSDRIEWQKWLAEPFAQRAVAHLKDICRVPGKPRQLDPGYDAVALAGLAYAHAQGQSSVFEAIADMALVRVAQKPLPAPFEREPRPDPKK